VNISVIREFFYIIWYSTASGSPVGYTPPKLARQTFDNVFFFYLQLVVKHIIGKFVFTLIIREDLLA